MLYLDNIKKEYHMSDITIHALKGITINFRKSEFVSILGASGCGKTTLLNIIGGLDSYTSGDLVIGNRSTKEYKSRDWDRYRNKTIGFVFQSYNLIPHLNVLQNVELALTISGIGKKQKKAMALLALQQVGLGEEIKKRPSEMSGGQMQRVAIARAIVNNPDIILADEPTGALDSTTSHQVIDILKEISTDRLVIMVTHNREIAESYSSRIVEVKDGEIISDSNPYEMSQNKQPEMPNDLQHCTEQAVGSNQAVGTEQILGTEQVVSTKQVVFTEQAIDTKQTIDTKESIRTKQAIDTEQVVNTVKMVDKTRNLLKFKKKPRSSMSLLTALTLSGKNLTTKKVRTTLTAFAGSIGIIGIALVLSLSYGFQLYMAELEESTLSSMPITISSVGIKINVNDVMNIPSIDGEFPDTDKVLPIKPSTSMNGVNVSANFITDDYIKYIENLDKNLVSSVQYFHSMKMNLMSKNSNGKIVSLKRNTINWQELLWDDFMKKQYDTLAGGYPGSKIANDVLSSTDNNYQSYTEDGKRARQAVLVISSYNTIETSILEGLGYTLKRNTDTNTYEPIDFKDLLGQQIKVLTNDDFYQKNHETGMYTAIPLNTLDTVWESEKNIDVTIVGVMRMKDNVMFPFLKRGIAYTQELTNLALENAKASKIAVDQLANADVNLLNGNNFNADFSSLVSMFSAYGISETSLTALVKIVAADVFGASTDENLTAMLKEIEGCASVDELVSIMNNHGISPTLLKVGIAAMMSQNLGIDISVALKIFDNAYQTALQNLGANDTPSSIYIYPNSFDNKKQVLDYLDAWNSGKASTETVDYSDLASMIASIITRLVNIVSYILISFATISLVVSSLMIGIITYISVIERTTEIGVLRAIGARKIDIANVFNAETLIIGLTSGIVGVFVAWILDFPLNIMIAKYVADAPKEFAVLNPLHGILLVLLSVGLTVFSGLLPAYMASRKDPVKALRNNG